MITTDHSSPHLDTQTSPSLRSELLSRRYLLKDDQGKVVETPTQMFERVAMTVAQAEGSYGASKPAIAETARRFYRLMASGLFLPNSPTLMNAGRPQGLLSACFVLPIEDSIDGIFDSVTCTARIQKAGGGTGFSFDTLRPTGDLVASSGGKTSGPISFWRVFAQTTEAIQQGAHRRGANMGMMSVEHPDILKFIHAKQNRSAFCNFNISVKIPDSFMTAVRDRPEEPHVVVNPRSGRAHVLPKTLDVGCYAIQDLWPADRPQGLCYTRRDIWNMIVVNAHATGEPGICFIDRVNESNPTPQLGRIEATNPCGEQPLLPYEACNLGSINLAKCVRYDLPEIDWRRLGRVVRWAIRFLDDVIDVNYYPDPRIREISLGNRKIGLGVMGFADCLILTGVRYDSPDAVDLASRTSRFIQREAHAASQALAESRGRFPNWPGSLWDTGAHAPMRNACCTTIAPTGSISLLADCSSGIEPIYRLAFRRRAMEGREFVQVHPLLERLGHRQGWMTDKVRQALLDGAPLARIGGLPEQLGRLLVTAHEIEPEWHVRMQAAFQAGTDNAVSKTVNLPEGASPDDVDRVFHSAYDLRCKGITVYRDGSRSGQTLSKASVADKPVVLTQTAPRPRVRITRGATTKFHMGCGTLFVTVNRDEKGLCEVFANLGKAGGCPAQSEATCRVISAGLRSGVDPHELIGQLRGIRCLSAVTARKNGEANVLSCPDAIARAIAEGLEQDPENQARVPAQRVPGRLCMACGHPLRREAGCFVCDRCYESSCG